MWGNAVTIPAFSFTTAGTASTPGTAEGTITAGVPGRSDVSVKIGVKNATTVIVAAKLAGTLYTATDRPTSPAGTAWNFTLSGGSTSVSIAQSADLAEYTSTISGLTKNKSYTVGA